ncbi:hypothetical protein ACFONI_07685 [Aeromonas media]|uniref:hypothetical protein n=1 Tax=Aeromonas media TaxID=651 RepID=UPI00360D2ECA
MQADIIAMSRQMTIFRGQGSVLADAVPPGAVRFLSPCRTRQRSCHGRGLCHRVNRP